MSVDVSVCVVNFNSAHWVAQLIPTIKEQRFSVAGKPGTLEIIVVDNASKGEDSAALQKLCDDQVRLVQNTMNTGYAQANNQGFFVARGRYHMVLNPDTRLLEGCLQEMISHLEANPDVAMVGPLAFMDPDCSVLMPPNELPTPELMEKQTIAQTDRAAALANLERRTSFSLPYWRAETPMDMEMLSGCCIMFRRELFETEWPFDPGYPLYYEDTDMFVRVRRRGRLVHLPKARIVHFFSRSAYTHAKGAEYRHQLSEARYFRSQFGEEGAARVAECHRKTIENRDKGLHVHPVDFEAMEVGTRAPDFFIDTSKYKDFYVEISGNPIFSLAAALFPTDPSHFAFTQSMWDQLGPNRYWMRLVSNTTLETLHAWELDKVAWL